MSVRDREDEGSNPSPLTIFVFKRSRRSIRWRIASCYFSTDEWPTTSDEARRRWTS